MISTVAAFKNSNNISSSGKDESGADNNHISSTHISPEVLENDQTQ
jgi:hypothetical protein